MLQLTCMPRWQPCFVQPLHTLSPTQHSTCPSCIIRCHVFYRNAAEMQQCAQHMPPYNQLCMLGTCMLGTRHAHQLIRLRPIRFHPRDSPPDCSHPQDEDTRVQTWIRVTSLAAGRNLVPFYRAWGFPIANETAAALEQLPNWTQDPMNQKQLPLPVSPAQVEMSPPADETGKPSVETGPPPAESGTPSVKTGTPPAETGTPSVETGTPPAETDTPPAETGTPPGE